VFPYMARMKRDASLGARDVPQGYGEGEEVALTVALTVALRSVGVAVGVVLWRVVAGRVLSLGPARSVLSMIVAEGTVRTAGSGSSLTIPEWVQGLYDNGGIYSEGCLST
jgi:hypothetical protein